MLIADSSRERLVESASIIRHSAMSEEQNLAAIAMKDLLEAGVHFGHQTKRWNPKMKEYIFGERNGIYIIDLGKTVKLFRDAEEFVSRLAAEGRTNRVVGTKRPERA